MALPVAQSGLRAYQCFPQNHPLYMSGASLKDADVVLALDVDIPWHADSNPPPDSAWVAMTDVEPAKRRIPTMEFTADLRLTADALSVIEALTAEVRALITPEDQPRFAARAQKCAEASAKRRTDLAEDAKSRASKAPIDPKWLSHSIGKVLDDNCIVFDETIAQNQLHDYLNIAQPGGYFHNPASSGGWASGAAFGAKLAAPDKDVIAVSGDGFYMFGTPVHALWAARHYKAPFMAVVYQNRSYSTGTLRINSVYGAKDSYAAKADYDGGYFDPPIDFAKEAEAAGAYGENVTDPAQIEPALRRGLKAIREEGRPGGDLGVARKAVAEGLNEEQRRSVERKCHEMSASPIPSLVGHLAAGAAVLGILSVAPALHEAQAQSGRTVRAIVPTPPAGVNDLMARLMADYLGKTHGLSMVVENRAGAAEVIGTEAVARAAPDGNTILFGSSQVVINPQLRKVNYHPLESFEPVCLMVDAPLVFSVQARHRTARSTICSMQRAQSPAASRWGASVPERPSTSGLPGSSNWPRSTSPSCRSTAMVPRSTHSWADT